MLAILCLTYTDRAPAALEPVQNDEKCAEEKLSQGGSQDADALASDGRSQDANAATRLPTTVHDLHADATSTKKPLARVTKSGRATRT